jgi:hypothetical protein
MACPPGVVSLKYGVNFPNFDGTTDLAAGMENEQRNL